MLQDPEYSSILLALRNGESNPFYRESHGLLYWKDRSVVLANSPLIATIMKEFHDSPVGGHAGYLRTYQRLIMQFFWHGMQHHSKNYVWQCQVFQQAKISHSLLAGPLHPLPIPQNIWEDVAMDFITGLPPVHGYTVILVVIDKLSKYAHLIPLKTHFTSASVVEQFIQHVVKLHGIPKTIVSDRDKTFTSHF